MVDNEIGENMSSGAEKVENIERTLAGKDVNEMQGVPEGQSEVEKERMAARRRVEEAKRRQREKKNRLEKRREKTPNSPQNVGNDEKPAKRGDGLGGWIAAVVSLGVVSLALTAVVTVGAIKMKEERGAMAAAYRGTMYETIHIVEDLDDDLECLQISMDSSKQAEILTDVLVKTRLAEANLEKLPVDGQSCSNTMRFFNTISMHCERMLDKLARGEELSEMDKELLEELYESDHKIRKALDELAATMEDDDVMCWMKGKDNRIMKTLQDVENNTTPKMPKKPSKPKEDKKPSMPTMPPRAEQEGGVIPFPIDAKKGNRNAIPSKKAEEFCRQYFADYGLTEVNYAGETLGKGLKAYNFEMKTEKGVGMFAQISQADGALIYFDYYEECRQHTHDIETAKKLAVNFLQKLGYENMIPVSVDESGTNADFTFAYSADGCTYYPDEIIVKVCEERGVVSGLDASKYLKNYRGRYELNTKITMQEARDKLSDKVTVESSRLVLFEHKGEELTAYEFFCAYGGQTYFIYLDAESGRELFIVNSKDF